MANKGGARPGAGRKPIAEEMKTRNLAISTLKKKFGSEQKALEFLLESGEASLIKFVYEHAFGKPPDKIDHGGSLNLFGLLNIDPLSDNEPQP